MLQLAILSSSIAGTFARISPGLRGDSHVALITELSADVGAPPMSPALWCIISITTLCVLVYTSLALVRTRQEFMGIAKCRTEGGLTAAAKSVACGPMLCALFVAHWMHSRFLSHGLAGAQVWVDVSMYCSSCALFAFVAAAFAIACLQPQARNLQKDAKRVELFRSAVHALTWAKHLSMCVMCTGVGLLIKGIYRYQPPPGSWPGLVPAPAPAVVCTAHLTVAFFAVQCVAMFPQRFTIFLPTKSKSPKSVGMILTSAANVVAIAPMIAALFLAARMHALQMDSVSGAPQKWAQLCFYNSSYAVLAQALFAIADPVLISGATAAREEREITRTGVCIAIFRAVTTLCIYGGPLAVMVSIFVLDQPQGIRHTPVSPSIQCVMYLMVQLLFAYLMVRSLATEGSAVESARTIVRLAPMLSVLIVAARMHAVQFTNDVGPLQVRALESMSVAPWALLVQFSACLGAGMIAARAKEGGSKAGFSTNAASVFLAAVRTVAAVSLVAGTAVIVFSILHITPKP